MDEHTDHLLPEAVYLGFPLAVRPRGPRMSARRRHVREQIEQVLFTNPGERVFRTTFGAGARTLIFEPAGSALEELTAKRLRASLAEALEGEVDPRTLEIEVDARAGDRLSVAISYALATIGQREGHRFEIPAPGGSGG